MMDQEPALKEINQPLIVDIDMNQQTSSVDEEEEKEPLNKPESDHDSEIEKFGQRRSSIIGASQTNENDEVEEIANQTTPQVPNKTKN